MQAGYPGSWYADSVGEDVSFPGLVGQRDVDVCIIGGGFTGLSAACSLTEQGYSVALLEAKRVGWGASGRNGGQMIRGFAGQERMRSFWGTEKAKDVDALTFAGHDLIRRRLDAYGIDCDLQPGWLEVATTPRQLSDLYHHYNEMETVFPDRGWQFMGAEEVAHHIGSNRFLGGMLSRSDGHLHPLKLCLGLARGAASDGAAIFENSAVTAVTQGKRVTVATKEGCITAAHLIVAANSHHRLPLPPMHGYASAASSYIIATEPVAPDQLTALKEQRWAICDTKTVCDYFRMTSEGRILFGGRVNYSGRRPKSVSRVLMPRLVKVWPQLKGIKVTHEWGGRLGVAIGSVPLLGKIGGNIWYGFGYTGHGVNMGNLVGDILAEAIAGNRQRFDLFARMPHRRLPFGQYRCTRWIGQQAVSLAMLYYMIRDRL